MRGLVRQLPARQFFVYVPVPVSFCLLPAKNVTEHSKFVLYRWSIGENQAEERGGGQGIRRNLKLSLSICALQILLKE